MSIVGVVEFLRKALVMIAGIYRAAFWVMVITLAVSAYEIWLSVRGVHLHPLPRLHHHLHVTAAAAPAVHWAPALKYTLPAAGLAWLVWQVTGKISAKYFSYIIDYSDIRSFGGGAYSDADVHRYTKLYRKWK